MLQPNKFLMYRFFCDGLYSPLNFKVKYLDKNNSKQAQVEIYITFNSFKPSPTNYDHAFICPTKF